MQHWERLIVDIIQYGEGRKEMKGGDQNMWEDAIGCFGHTKTQEHTFLEGVWDARKNPCENSS